MQYLAIKQEEQNGKIVYVINIYFFGGLSNGKTVFYGTGRKNINS